MKSINTESKIITNNLILEPISKEHAIKLFDQLRSEDLYTYIPQDPPEDILKLESRYFKWSKRKSDDEKEIWLNYALYLPVVKDYVGTVQATINVGGATYIAYQVFPNYWRQGIAKQAVSTLIEYLYRQYNISEITAHIDTRNEASKNLLLSLGFLHTETIYGADEFKGSKSDEYVFKLDLNKLFTNSE